MNKYKTLAAATVALLLMAACGSSGNGIGDIFGGGNQSNASYQIRGTVDSVDTRGRSIYLTNVSGYNGNLNGGRSSSLRVYYDNRTTLNYQGQSYRPDQLERGDEVTVNVDQSGNQLIAQSMDVTYNTRGGMASGSNGTYGTYPSSPSSSPYPSSSSSAYSTIRGTVLNVDSRNQTIELENTNWVSGFRTNNSSNRFVVRYDPNASVDYNGQMYPLTNLERGDIVDVQLQDLGNSSYIARSLVLVRNVR